MMAWTQHDRAAEGEIPACVAGAIPARSFYGEGRDARHLPVEWCGCQSTGEDRRRGGYTHSGVSERQCHLQVRFLLDPLRSNPL